MEGCHWRVSSDRDDNLLFIINGLESSLTEIRKYNYKTGGGILDLNEEAESVYGMAFIAMQNYINMICTDSLIILGYNGINYKNFNNSCANLRSFGDKINSKYSKVDLIYALANSIKHRNEMDFKVSLILFNSEKSDSDICIKDLYRKGTNDILDDLDLLSPIKAGSETDIYPVLKGLELLDKNMNLINLVKYLFIWARDVKYYCYNKYRLGDML